MRPWGLTVARRALPFALPLIARWRRRENSLRIYPCAVTVRFGVWPGSERKNPPGREPGRVKVPRGGPRDNWLQREDSNFRVARYWLWRATFPLLPGSKNRFARSAFGPSATLREKENRPDCLGRFAGLVGGLGSAGAPREGLKL